MNYLLDTHILLWFWTDHPALPVEAGRLLDLSTGKGEPLGLSTISLWEIAMLAARGRLEMLGSLDTLLSEIGSHSLLEMLPITACVAAESIRFGPNYPRDPVDRIIGATARCNRLRLITADQRIRDSGLVPLAC